MVNWNSLTTKEHKEKNLEYLSELSYLSGENKELDFSLPLRTLRITLRNTKKIIVKS